MSRRHSPQQNRGRSPLVKRASASLPAPTVSAITPNSGTTTLVKTITDLAGTGFVNGATVTIGGVAATSVVWVSSTKLTCVGPVGSAGAKDVVVTNPDAQTGTGTGLFTYVAFPTIANLGLRLESDIGLTASVTRVTPWVDQSSLGRSFTASGAGRPVEVTGQVNGLSAVRFDGAATFMTSSGTPQDIMSAGLDVFTVVAVWKNTSAVAAAAFGYLEPSLVASGTGGNLQGVFGNATQVGVGIFNSGDQTARKTQAADTTLRYTKTTLTAAAAGTLSSQVGTAGTPTTTTAAGIVGGDAAASLYLGRNYNASAFAKGDVFAIYGIKGSLSGAENTNLNAWINAKYGPGL